MNILMIIMRLILDKNIILNDIKEIIFKKFEYRKDHINTMFEFKLKDSRQVYKGWFFIVDNNIQIYYNDNDRINSIKITEKLNKKIIKRLQKKNEYVLESLILLQS